MRMVPYNRKINAPIKFLYYLEVFDLFILMVFGFLAPLFVSSFLPVDIPLWHNAIWLVLLTFLLIIIKIGRAPGFIQHWMGQRFRGRSYHPGKRELEYFLRPIQPVPEPTDGSVFAPEELREIQLSVMRLRRERHERQIMAENKDELI